MSRVLLLFLAVAGVSAQERFRLYTTDNGLPNNSVLAMRQARDGYLWFTTYRGIVRFDGVRFQVFDSSTVPAMKGTNFATFSLFEDHQGALWAGTWNAGAIRYHTQAKSVAASILSIKVSHYIRTYRVDQMKRSLRRWS